jgi:hypothetical protein
MTQQVSGSAPVTSAPPTNPSSAPASSSGSSTPCVTCTITTETVATQPANRARTTIGVGEEVRCTFSLGSATWSKSGSGTLSATSGSSISYTAPDVAGTDTVTATGSGCTIPVTFTIIAPSTISMTRITDVEHHQGYCTIGMRTDVCLGPDTVNFYNIKYHEVDCTPAVADGVYSCRSSDHHDAHPATLNATHNVTASRGTVMDANDHVYSGHCGPAPANPTGRELYNIPYEYKVGSGAFHRMTSVADHEITCEATGALHARKAGAAADTTVSSPTVTI